jgi:hypothetical protein
MVELPIESYLKADNINKDTIGEITDEGEIRTAEETGFEQDTFEIGVRIGDIDFKWTMNKTTQRNLASKWGKKTETWIGKKVKFRKITQNVRGKMHDVIFADPVI